MTGNRVVRIRMSLSREEMNLLYGRQSADVRWRAQFEKLKTYRLEYGDTDVPGRWKKDPHLAVWVSHQRERRKKDRLKAEEIALLEEVGFTWQSRERSTWEDRLAEIIDFKARHGHCNIPTIFPENVQLGRMVNSLRTRKNSGLLDPERIAELDAIGFVWTSDRKAAVKIGEHVVSEAWKRRYEEMLAYKQTHGDCDVPSEWPENEPLGNWVGAQRQRKKNQMLPPACEKLLDEAGFSWRGDQGRQDWVEYYAELQNFKTVHGHCDVSASEAATAALARWVAKQRSNRKLGRLTMEQVKQLDDLEFTWQSNDARKSWEERYVDLSAFRLARGHCDVSRGDPDYPALGAWVAAQRRHDRVGQLDDTRKRMLDEIGFTWQTDDAASPQSLPC